jgi:hypothetical protein
MPTTICRLYNHVYNGKNIGYPILEDNIDWWYWSKKGGFGSAV